jgi:hypothetical protein
MFNKWVACSVISAALRKKVKFNLGRIKIYPNLYVVLVAEPGVARKSQAISYGKGVMKGIQEINVASDAVTREALLEECAAAVTDDILPSGQILRHSSLTICSTEFETFLGQKNDNTKMLVLLTEFFDCGDEPFKYRTKTQGETVVPSVFLSILGATTPESLASSLPVIAIGGGLTSRILFVYARGKAKKVPIPIITPEMTRIKELLEKDLFQISRIAGAYHFSKAAEQEWIKWYNALDVEDTGRICPDPSFNGWYSRKHVFVCKMCQINAAAMANASMEITPEILHRSIADIEEVEQTMGRVFTAIGRSNVTAEVDTIMALVKQHKLISEKQLLSIVWRDMDAMKFENVIKTAIKTGKVRRQYKAEGGEPGIWYAWNE